MTIHVNVPGSAATFGGSDLRPASNIWVYVATVGWRRAKQVWVYDGAQWRLGHRATPGGVTVNYAQPTQQSATGTQATFLSTVSWSALDTLDNGFTATAQLKDPDTNTIMYTAANATSPVSTTFTISSGTTKSTQWTVYLTNGPVTGPATTSALQQVSYAGTPTSSVTSVQASLDTYYDTISVSWVPSGFPSGGYYGIDWQVGTNVPNTYYIFSAATFANVGVTSAGYDFVDYGGSNAAVYITVNMYDSSGTRVAYGTTTIYTNYTTTGGGGF